MRGAGIEISLVLFPKVLDPDVLVLTHTFPDSVRALLNGQINAVMAAGVGGSPHGGVERQSRGSSHQQCTRPESRTS